MLTRIRYGLKRILACISRPPVRYQSIIPLNDELAQSVSPVFVLSTGRCGTKWLTELLKNEPDVLVNHALQPELVRQSKRAYELWQTHPEQLHEIIRASRDDLISMAHHSQRIYLETNNRITFFAWQLKTAYPNSKFVHLYRHPADFIRSGMRRNWYSGHPADVGRITSSDSAQWQKMSQFEQIAWLWNETNQFIEDFLATLPSEQYFALSSENLFSEPSQVQALCTFMGVTDLSLEIIGQKQQKPVNVQKKGDFPEPKAWSSLQKSQFEQWCPLATKYDYSLPNADH